MRIDLALLPTGFASTHHAQQPFFIIPALDPTAHPYETPAQEESIFLGVGSNHRLNLFFEFRGHPFVGIQVKDPFGLDGKVVEGPVPLCEFDGKGVLYDMAIKST